MEFKRSGDGGTPVGGVDGDGDGDGERAAGVVSLLSGECMAGTATASL